jgi:hypothetical protein
VGNLNPGQTILFICLVFLYYASIAQDRSADIAKAESFYEQRLYKKACKAYFSAFKHSRQSKTNTNLLGAAKACSQAHYPDSAYKYLFIIVKSDDHSLFDDISYEPDFKPLYHDRQWQVLMAIIEKKKSTFNTPVADELISMYKKRYAMDLKRPDMIRQYSTNSVAFETYQNSVETMDSINISKLRTIIHTYGWPGPAAIGDNGVQALIFIFQKANSTTQKNLFPLIAEAFKKGDISAKDYAIIADRISLADTGEQIYGTQGRQQDSHNLLPIENKDSVNIRRRSIGLDTIPMIKN